MRQYLTFFKLRFITSLQYRSAAIAGVLTQFFFGIVYILVYLAFYESNNVSVPMTFQQLVTYIWLGQAFYSLTYVFYRDKELMNMIKNGDIAYELCRPQVLYFKWYIKILASKVASTLLKFLPMLIIALLLPSPFNLSLPSNFNTLIVFIISLLIATLLVTSIVTLFHIITFFTIDDRGVLSFLGAFAELFAGLIVPIPFLPRVLQILASILPFKYMSDLPFRLYSGNISLRDSLPNIIIQVIWVVILIALGYLLSKKALKKVVVQGG